MAALTRPLGVAPGFELALQCSSKGSTKKDGSYFGELAQAMSGGAGAPRARRVRFLWPSAEVVRRSFLGWAAGGDVPCASKNMYAEGASGPVVQPAIQAVLADFDASAAGRERASPHMKSYARYRRTEDGEVELAWFCMSSSNVSQAAWGTLQKRGAQLYVMSWELGVLLDERVAAHFPRRFTLTPSHPVLGRLHAPVSAPPTMVQGWPWGPPAPAGAVRVPVPYRLPPQDYPEGHLPWVTDRVFEGTDGLGRLLERS